MMNDNIRTVRELIQHLKDEGWSLDGTTERALDLLEAELDFEQKNNAKLDDRLSVAEAEVERLRTESEALLYSVAELGREVERLRDELAHQDEELRRAFQAGVRHADLDQEDGDPGPIETVRLTKKLEAEVEKLQDQQRRLVAIINAYGEDEGYTPRRVADVWQSLLDDKIEGLKD